MPAPPTQKGQTRRFSRQLAQACRDRLPPEIIAEFWLTIVMGHGDAFIVEDDRCELGWRVDWDRDGRGSTSTNEEKARAMLTFQQAAFGTPAQSIQLQAHLTRSDDDTITLAPGIDDNNRFAVGTCLGRKLDHLSFAKSQYASLLA